MEFETNKGGKGGGDSRVMAHIDFNEICWFQFTLKTLRPLKCLLRPIQCNFTSSYLSCILVYLYFGIPYILAYPIFSDNMANQTAAFPMMSYLPLASLLTLNFYS